MPANNSPGVDWDEIAVRFKAGESGRSLARAFNITHTSVQRRAKREGWSPGTPAHWHKPVAQTKTAVANANPQTNGEKRIATLGMRGEANMRLMLALVSNGAKPGTASQSLGISRSVLADWRKDDPSFSQCLDAAEASQHVVDEGAIVKARDRGDWKAGLTRLERGRHTRDDWAAPDKVAGTGGITVVFNWSRDEPPPIIDVTPTVAPGDDTDGQA